MNLAIQGHSNRGNEVISYLEKLGGKNPYGCNGLGTLCAYRIIDGNIQIVTIEDLFKSNEYILYSLEGILAKFPYRVGDYARLSRSNIAVIIKAIKWENDEIVYQLSCDSGWWSVDNLKPYTMKITVTPKVHGNEDKIEFEVTNDYEIKEENGKYYVVKKQYPKTYDGCCKVLGYEPNRQSVTGYHSELIENFQIILVCRDAYWKIAGEQMGLGKPWEPNFTDTKEMYYIFYKGYIEKGNQRYPDNHILIFPTPEMRDAFYENFKELIETCKELL